MNPKAVDNEDISSYIVEAEVVKSPSSQELNVVAVVVAIASVCGIIGIVVVVVMFKRIQRQRILDSERP